MYHKLFILGKWQFDPRMLPYSQSRREFNKKSQPIRNFEKEESFSQAECLFDLLPVKTDYTTLKISWDRLMYNDQTERKIGEVNIQSK